jgi:hypothetical protein
MANVQWRIKGREFVNCNCAYGCPCQFSAPPTYGECKAMAAYVVDEGHYGETRLEGLRAAILCQWPGAIHEGNGEVQAIIDERAVGAQREALGKIVHGEDTEPGATMWQVFSTTFSKVHDTLYRPIDFELDVDGRTATVVIPGVVESSGEPIRNPVTGAPHRARIDLPEGFEFSIAEIGSGSTKARGAVTLDLAHSYTQLARIHLTQNGVVR